MESGGTYNRIENTLERQTKQIASEQMQSASELLREMSARMSKARRRTAELRHEIGRVRKEMHLGPLQAVRDFRLITEPPTPRRRRR